MESKTGKKKHRRKAGKSSKKQNKAEKKSNSEEEFVDLAEELYPIGHYINDKSEMIQQIFSVMEKEKLNTMLPPILKGVFLEDLKKMCLEQLEMMPKNQILKILNGESAVQVEQTSSPSVELSADEDSLSSSDEEFEKNALKQNKTLLDILEQEMQAIAYRTVLKKESASNMVATATPDLSNPDAVVKQEPRDEVISGHDVVRHEPDDLVNFPCGSSNASSESNLNPTNDLSKIFVGEALPAEDKNLSVGDQNELKDQLVGVSDIENPLPAKSLVSVVPSISVCNNISGEKTKDCQHGVPLDVITSTPPHEGFLVKVFSRCHNSTERIVRKISPYVCKSQVSKKSASPEQFTNVLTHGNISGTKEPENVMNSILDERLHLAESKPLVTMGNASKEDVDFTDDQNDLLSKQASHQKCSLEAEKTQQDSGGQFYEEKEEGELTDLESDDDVEILVEVKERHRSPTVFLSSSDEKEGAGECLVSTRKRKHHHHRSHHKVSSKGKSCLDRRIETRGNRSYRRKDSPSPVTNPEAQKEPDVAPITVPHCEKPVDSNNCSSSDTGDSVPEVEEEELSEPDPEPEEDEASPIKASWADRWAESKDIKKVVTTSKIYTTVRKRILSARRKKRKEQALPPTEPLTLPPVPPLVLHVEGSVQEYKMLQWLNPPQSVLDEDYIEENEVPNNQDSFLEDSVDNVILNKEKEIHIESCEATQ